MRVVNAISPEAKSTARHVSRAESPSRWPTYRPNRTRLRHSVWSPQTLKIRLISARVNARRFDSPVDLSCFTRTAGLTPSNHCRTALPTQIRSTFTLKFVVERGNSFELRSRNRAMSLICSVESHVCFSLHRENSEPFDDPLAAEVGGFLSLDCSRFRPCLAPRFDRSARQRLDVCCRRNVATPCATTCALRLRSACHYAL